LQLLLVLIKNPNFLILDEPTNDLDLMTLNILEEFLDTFPGCLIIVSHDRYFMDRLVEHLFVFEGEGVIRDFPGNYTDFREWDEERKLAEPEKTQAKELPSAAPAPDSSNSPASSAKVKASYKQKQEFKQLNETIAKLEAEKATITEQITVGTADVSQLLTWTNRLQAIDGELEELELSWLELSELDGITD
jgi:ATP-binding cassette subfamily F protein uup